MKPLAPPVISLLSQRGGIAVSFLISLVAKNRTTAAKTRFSLWSGDYDHTFTMNGAERSYVAAPDSFDIPDIIYATGLDVITLRVAFNQELPEWKAIIREYDPRLAPIEIHRAFFNPSTGEPAGSPDRIFSGFVDGIEIKHGSIGNTTAAELILVSSARNLTRILPIKRSDASQSLRGGDRLYKYSDVSGKVPIKWGTD